MSEITATGKMEEVLKKISEIDNLLIFGANDGLIIEEVYNLTDYKEIKKALRKLEVWTKALLEKNK